VVDRDRPFFLCLAFNAPHTPLQATREDYDALPHIENHNAAMIRALDTLTITDPEKQASTTFLMTRSSWVFRRAGGEKFLATIDGQDYAKGTGGETYGTAGLSVIWAEENTREAIYNAFRRKETFATSGPRIRVRFFAGYDFDDAVNRRDIVKTAYTGGVTMGSDLLARKGAAPKFLVWAVRDPRSASLQRVQIIKGWVDDGTSKETVYDVACSDGLRVDPETQRCPDNGTRGNLADCSITADVGDSELKTLWTDPDFDAAQRAFYYVRVLENPTCRWSTWDAIRADVEPRSDLKKTIQERAWSFPIWYTP